MERDYFIYFVVLLLLFFAYIEIRDIYCSHMTWLILENADRIPSISDDDLLAFTSEKKVYMVAVNKNEGFLWEPHSTITRTGEPTPPHIYQLTQDLYDWEPYDFFGGIQPTFAILKGKKYSDGNWVKASDNAFYYIKK